MVRAYLEVERKRAIEESFTSFSIQRPRRCVNVTDCHRVTQSYSNYARVYAAPDVGKPDVSFKCNGGSPLMFVYVRQNVKSRKYEMWVLNFLEKNYIEIGFFFRIKSLFYLFYKKIVK